MKKQLFTLCLLTLLTSFTQTSHAFKRTLFGGLFGAAIGTIAGLAVGGKADTDAAHRHCDCHNHRTRPSSRIIYKESYIPGANITYVERHPDVVETIYTEYPSCHTVHRVTYPTYVVHTHKPRATFNIGLGFRI